jgi:hypothetical protein
VRVTVASIRPARELLTPISVIKAVRFAVISIAYLTLILCAAATAVLAVMALSMDDSPFTKHILDHIGAAVGILVGSGGLGGFLLNVDKRERQSARYDRLLDELLALPPTKGKEKAIIDLINKMSS